MTHHIIELGFASDKTKGTGGSLIEFSVSGALCPAGFQFTITTEGFLSCD